MARQVDDAEIENVYRLQIMNATELPQQYHIATECLPGLRVVDAPAVTVAPTQARWLAVTLRLPPETAAKTPAGAHEMHFILEREAQSGDSARSLREKSTFVLPR